MSPEDLARLLVALRADKARQLAALRDDRDDLCARVLRHLPTNTTQQRVKE